MTIKLATAFVGAALGVGAVFGFVATVNTTTYDTWHPRAEAPWCPTEDSCEPDYDGTQDKWVIVELNP